MTTGNLTEEVDKVEAVSSSSDSSLPQELDDSISRSTSWLRPAVRGRREECPRALRSFHSAVGGRMLNRKTGFSLILLLPLPPVTLLGYAVVGVGLARHNIAENAIWRNDLYDLRGAGYCC